MTMDHNADKPNIARAFATERCSNCNRLLGQNGHGNFECAINSYHVRPSDIQGGTCIRCGSADVDLIEPDPDPEDWDETLDLVKCRNCGLIASDTK